MEAACQANYSPAPRATPTPLSCSQNFPPAQYNNFFFFLVYLDIRRLTHELIVNLSKMRPMPSEKSQTRSFNEKVLLARGKQ